MTRKRFSYILANFFLRFHSYVDNLKPLKMKFMAKFVPYDVLLCYNREIYITRGDDNNMAMSTVSSYKKLDNVRPCVGAQYSFQMPKNCCVPKCTKKGYVEEGKKDFVLQVSIGKAHMCSTSGYVRFVETLGNISRLQTTLMFAQGILKTGILKFH